MRIGKERIFVVIDDSASERNEGFQEFSNENKLQKDLTSIRKIQTKQKSKRKKKGKKENNGENVSKITVRNVRTCVNDFFF